MTGFVVGQPVVWGGLPFIVTAMGPHGVDRLAAHTGVSDPGDGLPFTADEADLLEVECAWFARCDHTAVALEPHPVLGPVPICERCQTKGRVDR